MVRLLELLIVRTFISLTIVIHQ